MLAVWLTLWMLWRVRQAGDSRASRIALLSLCTGLTCLIFPAGFALALFVLIWFLCRRQPLKEKARDLVTLAVLGSMMMAPWFLSMARARDYRPLVLKLALHLPVPWGTPLPQWAPEESRSRPALGCGLNPVDPTNEPPTRAMRRSPVLFALE
jgi:4-amino-4-deoxy-L-arabinose transferase-like glycosyltransferase